LAKLVQTTIFAHLPVAIRNTPVYVGYGDGVRYLYAFQATYDNKSNKLFFWNNISIFTRFRFHFNEGTYDANFGETISNTAYKLLGFNKTISRWSNEGNNLGFLNPPDERLYAYTGLTYPVPSPPVPAGFMDDKERGYYAYKENALVWNAEVNFQIDGTFLVSPSHVEIHNGLHHVYFQIKEADNKHTFSHSHSTFTFSIPLTSETGFYTSFYPDPNHNDIITIPNATKVLNIKCINDEDEEVDFKSLNYTFTLIQQ
jgi:hypothetical protein